MFTPKFQLLVLCFFGLINISTGGPVFSDTTAGFRLNHLSIEDGLPNNSVSSILQGNNQYLWFGTQGGLARYDGYEFKVFNQDPFDKNSLSHNLIQTMKLDDDGSIWIGTYNGLNHFDPISERFTRYIHSEGNTTTISDNVVVSIYKDSQGRLWAGTLNGLNLMNDDGTFRQFLPDENNPGSLPNKVVRDISEDSRGNIWIATYGGICRWDEAGEIFQTFSSAKDQGGLPGDTVMSIARTCEDDILWLGFWDGGIIKLNTVTGDFDRIETEGQHIYKLYFDSDGKLWAGTWGQGILIIDTLLRTIINHKTETSEELTHDVIYSLYEDESGVMWIGTNGGGLNKYVKWHNRFKYYQNLNPVESSLSKGKIYSFLEDDLNRIWVGIYGAGLNRINKNSDEITRYSYNSEESSSLSNDIVNSIIMDSKSRIWIGTNNGLCLYLRETDNFKRIYNPYAVDQASENIIYRVFEAKDGKLWLGTYNSGILVYSPQEGTFVQYKNMVETAASLSNNLIREIMQDSIGQMWIGTNSGLNLFKPESGTFRRFMHGENGTVSSNDIRALYENNDGSIWIGTIGGGISIYNPETDSFSYRSRKDGLLSNMIVDINSKSNGEIWIAEQNGISIYMSEHDSFRQITSSSGLLDGELTSQLLFTTDNFVFCGGTNGITAVPYSFYDEDIYLPEIRIIKIEINGQDFFSGGTPIKNGTLNLRHSQNNFNIVLNSTDYSFTKQNRFIYKLEGFNPEWTPVGNRNFITYTNLPSGRYTLYAKGSGSRNNWSKNTLMLQINRTPHPLLSVPAITAYAIIVLILIILIFLRIDKKRDQILAAAKEADRRNKELEQRVKERTTEIEEARQLAVEASGAKSLFLANMSHEIRTPLNGILGMLSLLKKTETGNEQKQYIDYSQISAENLLLLLDDILDYEKLKSGKVKVQEETFNLPELIEYIRSLFSISASEKKIRISISYSKGLPENLSGDKRKLTQILSNLMSNAVKYTDSGYINLKIEGNTVDSTFNCRISVIDSGRGIPDEKIGTIFNSFEQLDSTYTKTQKGVGLGLAIVEELISLLNGDIKVDSYPEKGTKFTIQFPLELAKESESVQKKTSAFPIAEIGKSKVMIVEDEAINRLYITKLLKNNGYDFITCVNGREAIEKYMDYEPNIILMDIGMPVMNGMEAVIKIREIEIELKRHALIIMLSAHVYKDDIERTKQAGADDFLGKPFNEQEFIKLLHIWSNKID
jgi:signal transduction histidine kinase/ligand-binding sensor domain-containing protein/CheY-like chemotaxis protein